MEGLDEDPASLLTMQCVSWHAEDVSDDDDDDSDDDEGNRFGKKKYQIHMFGMKGDGRHVHMVVDGYRPNFYVYSPQCCESDRAFGILRNWLTELAGTFADLVDVVPVHRTDFWGYSNMKPRKYANLIFSSLKGMRMFASVLTKRADQAPRSVSPITLYESNVDPILRFFHVRNVRPASWIQISSSARTYSSKETIEVFARPEDVSPCTSFSSSFAPLLVSSFDIECDSMHGDFPVPSKDYRRLALDADILWSVGAYKVPPLKQMTRHNVYEAQKILISMLEQAFEISVNTDSVSKLAHTLPLVSNASKPKESLLAAVADDVYAALRDNDSGDRVESVLAVLNRSFLDRWPLKGDPIIQIGVTSHKYGETCASLKCIFVLGTCEIDSNDDIEVHAFDDEASLIVEWARYMKRIDPEIVVGYNIFGFDFEYIHARACALKVDDIIGSLLTRLPDTPSKLVVREMSSSALGDNVLKYLDMPGRILIDLMKVVQRDHRLDSYKLDSVARHFTGEAKDDISPKDIFRLQKGSAADRGIIAKYCIQDCALCNLLVAKLEIIANNTGMANVCWVPLSHIFMRGQGVKIFSLVAKQCLDDGFVIPTRRIQMDDPSYSEVGYEGAIVLEPKTGMYLDEPVSVLDYNSLYPSSMISENISHDTLVTSAAMASVPGVEYVDIYPFGANGQVCRFAQSPKGILPRILEMLLKERKATRARIPGTTDVFQRAVLEGLQLAYKTTANSLYGQMGARTSPLYLREIAASTTATGRSMILLAKNYIEKEFKGNVVYGDSVPGYTPIILRIAKKFMLVQSIDELVDRYVSTAWKSCLYPREDKEYLELDGVEIWSDDGWTPTYRLIRHRLDPSKQMMRVATDLGVVDVTDDHSLLRADGVTHVTPKDLKNNEEILHFSKYPHFPTMNNVRRTKIPVMASMRNMGPVPMCILTSPIDTRLAYWSAIFRPIIVCSNQVATATVVILAHSLGFEDNITVLPSGLGVAVGVFGYNNTTQVNSVTVLHQQDQDRPEYVYDFTTESHKFAAGVGSIVVHNTDSLFVVFPPPLPLHSGPPLPSGGLDPPNDDKEKVRLAHSISCGQAVSKGIFPLLKSPHNLEYEKTFFPLVLLSKKRYVGLLYEDDPNVKPKQKSMGIALKRRDYAPIVKRVYGGVIDVVLTRRDIPAAVSFLRDALKELALGNTPIEELVISKTLKAHYKFPEQIAHSVLARRMFARDPGSAPQVNDRIPYVFVETSKENALMGDRIEHVDYVRAHASSVRIDAKTYIESQLTKPCVQLLAIALESIPGYNPNVSRLPSLSSLIEQKEGDETKARTRLNDLREREVNKLIFDPILALPVFRARDNRCKGQQEITSFFKRVG